MRLSESRRPGQRLLTIAAYVTVALCWSGSWTAAKLGVEAIPPIELSTIRFALAGLLMLAIARVTGASLGLSKLPLVVLRRPRRTERSCAVLASGRVARIAYLVVFATIIGFVLFYWAVRRFGAGMASMVSYLAPIFALIQAVTILGEQPEPLEIVGGRDHPRRLARRDTALHGGDAARGRGAGVEARY